MAKEKRSLKPATHDPLNVPHVKKPPATSDGEGFRTYNADTYKPGIGNRAAFPLPQQARGPIRAREARKSKGIPGY